MKLLPFALVILTAAALSACGGDKKPAATQVVAKVNDTEISVHQVNFILQRQPGLKPEQAQAAGKQVLDTLVMQELAVQKAKEGKLDRNPGVAQALQAAEREVLARAYVDTLAAKAPKPTEEQVAAYFNGNPNLFTQRRVYTLTEFSVNAASDKLPELRALAQGTAGPAALSEALKARGFQFGTQTLTRPAEALPPQVLPRVAAATKGQALLTDRPGGALIMVVSDALPAPVDQATARPAIERLLLAEAARKVVDTEMAALRAAAKVEFVGAYAASAPAAGTAQAVAPAPAPEPTAAPAPVAPPTQAPAADPMKGISGLK